MSSPKSRLRSLTAHFLPSPSTTTPKPHKEPHIHTLSPTCFLPRAAEIEPDAEAIFHITANGQTLRRSYAEFADRARGLAYFLMKRGLKRVGILAPNTPAFLESIFGIAAAGGGENISSVALESMLVQHPFVLEAGVVSVADSHWGERPKAFITVRKGKELTGEALIEWAKHESSISKFMVPREVAVVEELPKTSTGKLKKNVLRMWARGDYSEK
ncbi:unnamed protein product [Diplocarpon coronariae]